MSEPALASTLPIPLIERERPPVIPELVDTDREDAIMSLSDTYDGEAITFLFSSHSNPPLYGMYADGLGHLHAGLFTKSAADAVFFTRVLHNLARFESEGDYLTTALENAHVLLRPGGIFGVVHAMLGRGHDILFRLTKSRFNALHRQAELIDQTENSSRYRLHWTPSSKNRRTNPGLPEDACVTVELHAIKLDNGE